MTKEIEVRRRSLHPAYDKVCDEVIPSNHILRKALQEAASNNCEELQKIREAEEQSLPGIPLRETIRTRRTICGGPENRKVNVSIYRPIGSEDQVLPIIIYSHGGGFTVGCSAVYSTSIADFCIDAHMIVVFVEYSLSPEAKFPVAPEEVYAVLCWLRENAASINGDPERLVVLGDSAGGNLSAVVSLMAKDRGLGNAIKAQVLFYPCISDTTDFPSYEKYGDGYHLLAQKTMELFYDLYLPKPANVLQNIYATPIIASRDQLNGLPPALIVTAEHDILRDEGEEYARKLLDAGVDAVGIRVLGTMHGFFTSQIPPTTQYRTTFKVVLDFIRKNLNMNDQ